MHIPLELAPISILIHPFPIIRRQPIIIDPYSALSHRNNSLRPVRIDRYLIPSILVTQIDKSSHWIAIPIHIIIPFRPEMCLIVLVFEELAFHYQPPVGICVEFLVVFYVGGVDLEVQVL